MDDIDRAEEAMERAHEAFARFDVDAIVAHLSAAVRGFTAAGANRRAAMACVELGDVMANALGNLTASRAWFTRARRLVEDEPPCLEQGWVAVAAVGCEVDDPAELLASAELALDRARRFGDINLEAKALADAGLAHVQAGRVTLGMQLLDEAMALVCGPADSHEVAGKSVCSFFTACYFAADFDRVGSWTGVLRQHGLIGKESGPSAFLSSHCDSVQATMLMELGRWNEAEALLEHAIADFEAVMPFPSWHPSIALADLRIRQGRLADAEAQLVGKDHSMQALLPAAQLHLARGDHDLARATAERGLRVAGDDRLRAVELLAALAEAELGRGDIDAASAACARLDERLGTIDGQIEPLIARAAIVRAHTLSAAGEVEQAIETLEVALDRLDGRTQPWMRARQLIELARLRDLAGHHTLATHDARAAAAALVGLDVSVSAQDQALLARLIGSPPPHVRAALLACDGKWWTATSDGISVRLADSKGMRYLAALVARPGVEQHALDLVDRIEGVDPSGPGRRSLGDAGPLVDSQARHAYRRRVETLRADVDDALAAGQLETAEALENELSALVHELAASFGLGGRDRRAASAAERARLNVTRALRAAISRIVEALPESGDVLDRRVRTGLYCAFEPVESETRWIVQDRLNDTERD